MQPIFFKAQSDFREWLSKHYKTSKEILVGFYKVDSGKPSITWPQSVDEALCFGWIDGVRKGRDEESYTIRFTPRKPTSIWSTVNINKVAVLKEKGLMMPEGLHAFELKRDHKSEIYSYEKEATPLSAEYEEIFRKDKKAWAFFNEQAPSYKKQMIHRIMDAKQQKTQLSRLEKIIAASKDGQRVP